MGRGVNRILWQQLLRFVLSHLNTCRRICSTVIRQLVTVLIASCTRAIVLVTRRWQSILRSTLGCRPYCWPRYTRMDAWGHIWFVILVVATLRLLLLLVFTCPALVTVRWVARARHRQNFSRSNRLARALNNSLACVLTFLSEGSLQVTANEGIRTHVRGLFNALE